jgi:hypothetical protein
MADSALFRRWRVAKIAQRQIRKEIGISLAGFRKLDDSLRDYCDDGIVSIRKSKGRECHFQCDAHDALGLGIELLAV